MGISDTQAPLSSFFSPKTENKNENLFHQRSKTPPMLQHESIFLSKKKQGVRRETVKSCLQEQQMNRECTETVLLGGADLPVNQMSPK